jgi:hypothetical protein
MQSIFDSVIREAQVTYLLEQDEAAAQQMPAQDQQAAPAPQDAAVAQQPNKTTEQIQSGYDVFRTVIIQLLRIIAQTAGAVEGNDSSRLQSLKSSIPADIEEEINIAISQMTVAEPAAVLQATSDLIKKMES